MNVGTGWFTLRNAPAPSCPNELNPQPSTEGATGGGAIPTVKMLLVLADLPSEYSARAVIRYQPSGRLELSGSEAQSHFLPNAFSVAVNCVELPQPPPVQVRLSL